MSETSKPTTNRGSVSECFVLRCGICQHRIEVEWGPETHSTARRELLDHVLSHADYEFRDWAICRLVPREGFGE